MNIETRISSLNKKLRIYRIIGPLGLAGTMLLYLALAIPAFDHQPVMALCLTLCIVLSVPSLLRWHAFRVERKVLEDLKPGHGSHA